MFQLAELLSKAAAKGLTDQQIATITGRDRSTVWRWRKKPDTAFVFDEGIRRLEREVRDGEPEVAQTPAQG